MSCAFYKFGYVKTTVRACRNLKQDYFFVPEYVDKQRMFEFSAGSAVFSRRKNLSYDYGRIFNILSRKGCDGKLLITCAVGRQNAPICRIRFDKQRRKKKFACITLVIADFLFI